MDKTLSIRFYDLQKDWTEKLFDHGLGLVFFNYAAIGVALVLLSSCLVMFWAPAAAGGGVCMPNTQILDSLN